jgi:Phytanoyl-CoA dioxygenase (PhyH)
MVGDSSSSQPGSPPVALTASQWLQLDVYGFVLIDGVLKHEEIRRMKDALYRLKTEPDLDALGVYVNRRNDHLFHVGHVLEYDPALLEYAAHPRLTALAGEVVGGKVRVEETEAIINSRDPALGSGAEHRPRVVPTGFHTGARHGWGTYYENHHFHSLFVKTLAYLTDVGPDDGGTAVIPGSHRLSAPEPEIIAAALADERLVHQVEARAGSVLLFPESLVHSTAEVRSERERVVLITGFTPPMMRVWPGNEPSPAFVASLPDEVGALVTGADNWAWRPGTSG